MTDSATGALRAGLTGFTLASLACGLSPNSATLVMFRLLQGVGAALMMPQVMSLIQRTFTGALRARALSLYATVIACGVVVGRCSAARSSAPTCSAPAGGRSSSSTCRSEARSLCWPGDGCRAVAERGARPLDPAGVLTLSLSVLLLVVPLVLGHEEDWPLWGWLSLASSGPMFAIFVLVERSLARRGGSPLVSGRVLRAPVCSSAAVPCSSPW